MVIRFCTMLLVLGLVSCKPQPTGNAVYIQNTGRALGTSFKIKYEHPEGKDIRNDIISHLDKFEDIMSVYRPHSIVSRINRNDPDVVPDEYFTLIFNKARQVYEATDGLYDVTVAPLVNAWGFGFEKKADMPSTKIDSLLELVGMNKVRIKDGKFIKDDPRIMLDFNSIAKGCAVDFVANLLESRHMKNYMVEIGGEIRVKGINNRGTAWILGIDKPFYGNLFPGMFPPKAKLMLKDRSMATSGEYRRYYEEGGKKYSHIIDPRTGYSVSDTTLLSVTILADDCMTADAWATACMVSGTQAAIKLLEKHPELDAYLIYSDSNGKHKSFMTKGVRDNLIAEAGK